MTLSKCKKSVKKWVCIAYILTRNFKKIVRKNKFKVFDMRNIYSPTKMKKLKIDYFGIGR